MDAFLFGILLSFAFILLIFTFIRRQIVLGVFTSLVFIVLGIFSWNGLEYVSRTDVTVVNATTTSIVDTYSSWNHFFGDSIFSITNVMGTIFILFGLFMLIVSAVTLLSGKSSGGEELFSGGEDE
jgi:hypothetical protein